MLSAINTSELSTWATLKGPKWVIRYRGNLEGTSAFAKSGQRGSAKNSG
jgi:hypothetical protein